MKKISIFGSTGSIGRSTIDVLRMEPDRFDVQVLTANSRVKELAEQAIRLNAGMAVIADPQYYGELKTLLSGSDVVPACGREGLLEAASVPADWSMMAIVGMAGLEPLMHVIRQGTYVAIANKEPLVSAGPLVMSEACKYGTTLLPVDSEHNAVFQVYDRVHPEGVRKIILTASGGPFLRTPIESLVGVTPEQALQHPNWSMGRKISIDSATMMNKALEVIEAHYLFDMPADRIEVLIHPQSVVHSMVEYLDGSILSQMGAPDMRTPIAHALAWPKRMISPVQRLDLKGVQLTFDEVDIDRFPAVPLAYECLQHGSAACAAMNAANEIAVEAFLDGRIGFTRITGLVRDVLEQEKDLQAGSLDDVIALDKRVRETAESTIMNKSERKAVSL